MPSLNYDTLFLQIKSLLQGEIDLIANLSNTAAALHIALNQHWTGFYIVKNNELVLGPFQGPVACTRIEKGKGVCGSAWLNKQAIVVDNVHEFDGHIACSALSNSEIVVPIIVNNEVQAVLDIDSIEYSAFNNADLEFLTKVCTLLSESFKLSQDKVN